MLVKVDLGAEVGRRKAWRLCNVGVDALDTSPASHISFYHLFHSNLITTYDPII